MTTRSLVQNGNSAPIVRRFRKQAGLSQGALGDQIHLRQGTVSRLEAGDRPCNCAR